MKNFANLARRTKKAAEGQPWELTTQGMLSFLALKEALSDQTCMKIAELDKPFVPPSRHGLGAVLLQADEKHNDRLRQVEYASRRTNLGERNYVAMELEALAVVQAVRKLSDYLRIRRFRLQTDYMDQIGCLISGSLKHGQRGGL